MLISMAPEEWQQLNPMANFAVQLRDRFLGVRAANDSLKNKRTGSSASSPFCGRAGGKVNHVSVQNRPNLRAKPSKFTPIPIKLVQNLQIEQKPVLEGDLYGIVN